MDSLYIVILSTYQTLKQIKTGRCDRWIGKFSRELPKGKTGPQTITHHDGEKLKSSILFKFKDNPPITAYIHCPEVFYGDPWNRVWSLNGQRRDLVKEQRYLLWKYCHEQSEAWQTEQGRIQDEGNRKRAEAAKAQPRTKTGFAEKPNQQVVPQSVAEPI